MRGPADREREGGAYTCEGEQARCETPPHRRQDPSEDPDCTRQETAGPDPGPPCPLSLESSATKTEARQSLECRPPTSQAPPGEACSTPLPLLPKINEHRLCASASISLSPYSSAGQTSRTGPTGLRSRCQRGRLPARG